MSTGKNRKKRLQRQTLRRELDALEQHDRAHYNVRWQQVQGRWAREAEAALRAGDAAGLTAVFDRAREVLGEPYATTFHTYAADALRGPAVLWLGRSTAGRGRPMLSALRAVFGRGWTDRVVRELAAGIAADPEGEIRARAASPGASVWWLLRLIGESGSGTDGPSDLRALGVRELRRVGRSVRTALAPRGR